MYETKGLALAGGYAKIFERFYRGCSYSTIAWFDIDYICAQNLFNITMAVMGSKRRGQRRYFLLLTSGSIIVDMLAEQLKEQTKQQHQALEGKIIPRIKAITNHNDYARLLHLFYSYFGALEQVINTIDLTSYLPDYAERRKASWLTEDLAFLQSPLPAFTDNDNLPQIHNALQAMGALYVMEGSTLGGQHISKMIAGKLGMQGEDGLRFFKGYGAATMPRWNAFRDAINKSAVTAAEEGTAIDAANETFLRFEQWIDKQQ